MSILYFTFQRRITPAQFGFYSDGTHSVGCYRVTKTLNEKPNYRPLVRETSPDCAD